MPFGSKTAPNLYSNLGAPSRILTDCPLKRPINVSCDPFRALRRAYGEPNGRTRNWWIWLKNLCETWIRNAGYWITIFAIIIEFVHKSNKLRVCRAKKIGLLWDTITMAISDMNTRYFVENPLGHQWCAVNSNEALFVCCDLKVLSYISSIGTPLWIALTDASYSMHWVNTMAVHSHSRPLTSMFGLSYFTVTEVAKYASRITSVLTMEWTYGKLLGNIETVTPLW